jgi:hypothetical protein
MLIPSKFQSRLKWLAGAAMTAALLLGLYLVLRPQPSSVRGILLNVEATSLVYTERVVLRDDDGRNWSFHVSPEVAHDPTTPQTASHLRQHMTLVELVRVYYRATSEGPLIVRIADDNVIQGR